MHYIYSLQLRGFQAVEVDLACITHSNSVCVCLMRPFDLVGVFHTWWIRQSIALIKFSCIYIFIIVDQSDSFNVSGLNNKEVQSPQLKKTFMIVDELYIDRHCFFFFSFFKNLEPIICSQGDLILSRDS